MVHFSEAKARADEDRREGLAMQGAYLKRLRRRANLTQLEVAKALGFDTDGMVSHWEAGRNFVKADHYEALAAVLQTDEAALVFRLALFRTPALRILARRAMNTAPASGCGAPPP